MNYVCFGDIQSHICDSQWDAAGRISSHGRLSCYWCSPRDLGWINISPLSRRYPSLNFKLDNLQSITVITNFQTNFQTIQDCFTKISNLFQTVSSCSVLFIKNY